MWFLLSNLIWSNDGDNNNTFEMFRSEMLKCFDGIDPERCLSFLLNVLGKYKPIFILFGASPFLLIIFRKIYSLWKRLHEEYLDSKDPLRHMKIIEVKDGYTNFLAALAIVESVYHDQGLMAVGFDCEWVKDENNKQQPVSLLQIATANSTCALYRLSHLKIIFENLVNFLEDSTIIKLGVCPFDDAKHLLNDYGIQVRGCLDIRHLFPNHSGGLAALSKEILGVTLDKRWYIRCSNWDEEFLDKEQLDYAAKDALVAVEMFKKWLLNHPKSDYTSVSKKDYRTLMNNVSDEIFRYVDLPFHPTKTVSTSPKKEATKTDSGSQGQAKRDLSNLFLKESNVDCKRGFAIRKSPLYHNCFMYAPDGELLCSCDVRKAEWYLQKGIAERIPGEAFSIRLLFEPSGRAGDKNEGRYYTQLKQNRCVVCGVENSYLRHKVVPREYRLAVIPEMRFWRHRKRCKACGSVKEIMYRDPDDGFPKHFPNIMKNHQSHDVVLTCLKCHRLASLHDETLREKLAIMCDAPINNHKMINLKTAKKIQSSAKALLSSNSIPPDRREALETEIKFFYKINQVTTEVLQNCLNLETKITNEDYKPHGLKVVEYFIHKNGGILELEKMWRQHFLDTMRPEYLPALWSVTHNHERLAERAARNRVTLTDLEMAGFQSEIVKNNQD